MKSHNAVAVVSEDQKFGMALVERIKEFQESQCTGKKLREHLAIFGHELEVVCKAAASGDVIAIETLLFSLQASVDGVSESMLDISKESGRNSLEATQTVMNQSIEGLMGSLCLSVDILYFFKRHDDSPLAEYGLKMAEMVVFASMLEGAIVGAQFIPGANIFSAGCFAVQGLFSGDYIATGYETAKAITLLVGMVALASNPAGAAALTAVLTVLGGIKCGLYVHKMLLGTFPELGEFEDVIKKGYLLCSLGNVEERKSLLRDMKSQQSAEEFERELAEIAKMIAVPLQHEISSTPDISEKNAEKMNGQIEAISTSNDVSAQQALLQLFLNVTSKRTEFFDKLVCAPIYSKKSSERDLEVRRTESNRLLENTVLRKVRPEDKDWMSKVNTDYRRVGKIVKSLPAYRCHKSSPLLRLRKLMSSTWNRMTHRGPSYQAVPLHEEYETTPLVKLRPHRKSF